MLGLGLDRDLNVHVSEGRNLANPHAARAEGKEDQERKEYMRIMGLAEYRKQKDLDFLFATMRKNIESWWS